MESDTVNHRQARNVLRAGLFDESLRRLQDFDLLIRISEFATCASTDKVLWVKYWDAAGISAQDNMIPANVDLVGAPPGISDKRAYRPGLAYALRLSLWRRIKTRHLSGAMRDMRNLSRAFGSREAASLLFEACFPRPKIQ